MASSSPNSSLAEDGRLDAGQLFKAENFFPRDVHPGGKRFFTAQEHDVGLSREWLAGSIAEHGRFGGRMEQDTRKESSGSDLARLLESIVDGPVFGLGKAVERVTGRLGAHFDDDDDE